MPQPSTTSPLEPVEGLAELPVLARWNGVVSLRFVRHCAADPFMSLMVAAKASGGTLRRVAIEGHHVVAARRAIPEDENLAPPFGAQIHKLVARAAQKAGEIEVARLERGFVAPPRRRITCSVDTLRSPQKRGLRAIGKAALKRDLAMQQPELLQPDAHGDRRNEKLLGEGLGEASSA